MNARYFKEQICEELDGASCYLKKAIDYMKTHPDWSRKFVEMSEAEQQHATNLYKMFIEMYAESQGKDSYLTSMRDGIMDCFSKNMRKIEDLKTTLSMMDYEDTKSDDSKAWADLTPKAAGSSTLKMISE